MRLESIGWINWLIPRRKMGRTRTIRSAHLLDAGEDGERTSIGWIDFVKSLLDEIISRMRLIEIIVGLNHH